MVFSKKKSLFAKLTPKNSLLPNVCEKNSLFSNVCDKNRLSTASRFIYKKNTKKIKRRPKLFLAPLGQQFHLIGILYILPHLNKHEKHNGCCRIMSWKKSLSLPPRGKNCLLLIREKKNSLVFCWK